jgi:heavy metal sensor kinase
MFGIGARLAMQASIDHAIDDDLTARALGVRKYLEGQVVPTSRTLSEKLHEDAAIGLADGFFQVCDASGNVMYRSPALERYRIAIQTRCLPVSQTKYETRSSGRTGVRLATIPALVNGSRYYLQTIEPLHEFAESIQHFQTILWLTAPALLMLATLGGYWMSRRAIAPVALITNDARSIGVHNMSDRLAVPRSKDELQQLSETLNDMLGRIEKSVKQMRQFTADASHELRAPLTVIRTAAEFSLRRERTREDLLEAMQTILHASERTTSLIDKLLTLARADSHQDEPALAPFDLGSLLREVSRDANILAASKQISVTARIPSQPVYIIGDQEALRQLCQILVENAIKYTVAGGSVSAEVSRTQEQATILVRDTGIGIAPADLPRIFDRFWRADKVRSRETGGVGLGLAIASSIVERHQGTIEVESELGRGSLFRVCLPLDVMHSAGTDLPGSSASQLQALGS